jgi:hypothetical protein
MAKRNKTSDAAVVISVGAAIAAAWALLQKRAQAAPGQILSLDEATMKLLIAIAQASGNIDTNTLDALDKLQEIIDKIGVGGRGWPPNTEGTRAFSVACPIAATPYQASDMLVPDGLSLAIKSSPVNAAASLMYVARTPAECTNPNSAWPLVRNEAITFRVKNANAFYVSTDTAGSTAIFTAEQERG